MSMFAYAAFGYVWWKVEGVNEIRVFVLISFHILAMFAFLWALGVFVPAEIDDD